jgi:hypothetical protein
LGWNYCQIMEQSVEYFAEKNGKNKDFGLNSRNDFNLEDQPVVYLWAMPATSIVCHNGSVRF